MSEDIRNLNLQQPFFKKQNLYKYYIIPNSPYVAFIRRPFKPSFCFDSNYSSSSYHTKTQSTLAGTKPCCPVLTRSHQGNVNLFLSLFNKESQVWAESTDCALIWFLLRRGHKKTTTKQLTGNASTEGSFQPQSYPNGLKFEPKNTWITFKYCQFQPFIRVLQQVRLPMWSH